MKKIDGVLTDVTEEDLKLDPEEFWKGVTKIGEKAFAECRFCLREIEIPSSVEEIGDYAFYECENLSRVKLNEGLKKIGSLVFSEYSTIQSIRIPSSVEEMGARAIEACNYLENIYIDSTKQPILMANQFYKCNAIRKINIAKGAHISPRDAGGEYSKGFVSTAFPRLNDIYFYDFDQVFPFISAIYYRKMKIYKNEETGQFVASFYGYNGGTFGHEFVEYTEIDEYVKYLGCDKAFAMTLKAAHISLEDLINKGFDSSNEWLLDRIVTTRLQDYCNLKSLDDVLEGIENVRMYSELNKEIKDNYNVMFRLALRLGAFSKDEKVSKKACAFIEYLVKEKNIDFSSVFNFCDNTNTTGGYYPRFAELLMKDNNFDILSIVCDDLDDAVYFCNYNNGRITVDNCKKYIAKKANKR